MKKLLSLALVLALMLSLGVSAFAEIKVDGESKGTGELGVGEAQYVSADASGDELMVFTNVTGFENQPSVEASGGAAVTVRGAVTDSSGKDAINAQSGATVTVNRDVTESDAGHAIYVKDSGTTVTVKGDVTEEGDDNAIYAQKGATVKVYGRVEEKGYGAAINTGIEGDVTVIVGGDVTETAGEGEEGKYIAVLVNGENTTVIIEGTVDVDGYVGATNSGELYLGKLERAGKGIGGTDNIHYLIGVAPEGSAALSAVTLVSDIVANGTIDGVNEEGYKYTTTADTTDLNGKTIILKPADGKILTVSGFDETGVTYTPNEDGTVTFKLGSAFKGGLQNLVLVLTDKPGPGPDPTPVPVIYVVPTGSITVVEFTAPEGIEEGLITKLDSADHAGLTIDKSLLAEGYDHNVKVTRDNEELPEGAYRFVINWDGSLSLILSTTYLKTLGDGSYDFIATVDDLVIPFTVVVAE